MRSDSPAPLISIGMPVRNEAAFLEAALESLVNQADVRFEIIISDNASEDDTPVICRRYAERYDNIRYHRFEENVGSRSNFVRVLDEARGEYFIWASGHDLWESVYLSRCLTLLERHPDAVLAIGCTAWIDDKGEAFNRTTGWSDTRGLGVIARYCTVFWGNMNPVLGLMRVAVLRRVRIRDIVGTDLAILLDLALQGHFLHAADTTWYRREFRREGSYSEKLARYRSRNFGLGRSLLARAFPLAALPFAILGDVFRSELRFFPKLGLTLLLLVSFPVKYLADRRRKL